MSHVSRKDSLKILKHVVVVVLVVIVFAVVVRLGGHVQDIKPALVTSDEGEVDTVVG